MTKNKEIEDQIKQKTAEIFDPLQKANLEFTEAILTAISDAFDAGVEFGMHLQKCNVQGGDN